jgi:hypothetical protein
MVNTSGSSAPATAGHAHLGGSVRIPGHIVHPAAAPAASAELADAVLDAVLNALRPLDARAGALDPAVRAQLREQVAALCARYLLPGQAAPAARATATVPFDPFALPVEEPA